MIFDMFLIWSGLLSKEAPAFWGERTRVMNLKKIKGF